MEIAARVDISDFSDECDGVDEFVEWYEAVFELADRRDHVSIELFFDECDIGADAEAAAEHDVVGMWACTARFVAELNAVDFDFLQPEFFESFHAHFCDEVAEVYIAQGDVAVFVARGGFEEIAWEFFGEAFGQDDDAVFLFSQSADADEVDDVIDEDVDVEESVVFSSGVFHQDGDIFDADDHLSFAGHGDAVGEPAGFTAHAFGDELGARCECVGLEIAHFLRHEVDGGEIAESEVDAVVVVVDRLGEMDDADAFIDFCVVLVFEEFVGCFERIVAADGDERVDFEATEPEIGAS